MGARLRLPVTMPARVTWRCEALNVTTSFIQVWLFGCGGLILNPAVDVALHVESPAPYWHEQRSSPDFGSPAG
jgi:hypothetical protein